MDVHRTNNAWSIVVSFISRAALAIVGMLLLAPQISMACTPQTVEEIEAARIEAIARAKRSAVCVFGPEGQGGGSGVVITPDGYTLTNYHVVQGSGNFIKCSMPDGVLYDSVLVGIDPVGDVALIKLLGRDDFPIAEMADSDQVKQGDSCFAVGNPFLLATDFQPTVSWGIVSGVHRYQYPAGTLLEYADCIQTDAAINPGNSGGPLFNATGRLIGINGRGSFEKRGRVNVGVGYAISINQINNFMDHLRSGQIVDHATLGATVASGDDSKVVITNILESSDAYRRGLRFDDQIMSFSGRKIGTVNQFKNVLGIFPKGWRVPIEYQREGQRYQIVTRLAGVHGQGELAKMLELSNGLDQQEEPNKSPDADDSKQSPLEKKNKWAHLHESKPGYANYYFNRQLQEQVWDRFHNSLNAEQIEKKWTITGTLENKQPFQIVLNNKVSGIKLDGKSFVLDTTDEMAEQPVPPNSGGLLLALHLWRKMLVEQPEGYGNVSYEGGLPIVEQGTRNHVLTATIGLVETRFFFDQQTGILARIESATDVSVDPCIIDFDGYQNVDGCLMPTKLTTRYANQPPKVLQIESVGFSSTELP